MGASPKGNAYVDRQGEPLKRKVTGLKWILGVGVVAGLIGAVTILGAPKAEFNGDSAFALLKRQCDFGPRPVGSDAHERLRTYLINEMREVSDKVEIQDSNWSKGAKQYRLSNIIGVLNPNAKQKVMISGHWDTRPTADQDKDPSNRSKPIMGADDGASEVAVILELARALKVKRPKVGVYYMLFDGEDVGPNVDNMFLGARYFARHMGDARPDQMILVDMVGDANLQIYKELNSVSNDRSLVQTVWDTAAKLGYAKQFPNETKYNIEDDHLSMQEAGIPSIDLIDFDYPPWHTLGDTVDKCSPESLTAVGRTLQAVVMNWGNSTPE